MKKIFKLSVLPLALFVGTEIANAAMPGAYFGAGAGLGAFKEEQGLNQDKESTFAGRVFFGYNFNPYIGVETDYSAFSKIKLSLDAYPDVTGDYSFSALSFVGKGYLPLPEESPFNLYALFGVAQAYNKIQAHSAYSSVSFSDSGFVGTAGLGASYDLNRHLVTGLEFSVFDEKESSKRIGIPSTVLGTLSIAYKF